MKKKKAMKMSKYLKKTWNKKVNNNNNPINSMSSNTMNSNSDPNNHRNEFIKFHHPNSYQEFQIERFSW